MNKKEYPKIKVDYRLDPFFVNWLRQESASKGIPMNKIMDQIVAEHMAKINSKDGDKIGIEE
ncbi:MAG: hypothetical protein LUC99_00015 [Clostridiales bacterium]|nr:hypothetical protein [Clostridiales bacterium]